MTGLMWLFSPAALPGLAAAMAVTAALLVLPEGLRGASSPEDPPSVGDAGGRQVGGPAPSSGTGWRWVLIVAALLTCLAVVFSVIRPPVPVLSEFKGLSRALHLPEARITAGRSSPYGLLQVFASPALRYAPGLSLTWQKEIPVGKAVFNNGDWFGAVVPRQGEGPFWTIRPVHSPMPWRAAEAFSSSTRAPAASFPRPSTAARRGSPRLNPIP